MTPERLTKIEAELARAALSAPLDGRQRYITLALELVDGLHRAHQLRDGAREKAATFMRWYQAAKGLTAEAVLLLQDFTSTEVGRVTGHAHNRALKFIQKAKDNEG